MIISSGFNVYPAQIEKVLKSDPRVDGCVVIGQPHPYKVEVPVAYIVLKPDVKKDFKLKKELKALCIKNLARHSIPSKFEFKDELPKTLMGKIDYKSLQKKKGKK
jgi:AMP-dependent synthetase/ligase